MAAEPRPRCQVLHCQTACALKGRDADGTRQYRSRCVTHHRCRTPIAPPAGVRPLQPIRQSAPPASTGLEVIARELTPDLVGGETPVPGKYPVMTAPLADQIVTQLTLDDADVEGVVLALRLRGISQRQIAALLGKHPTSIQRILRNARADHKLNDVLVDLSHQALPLAVERLLEHLDEGEPWAIKETVRGLGAFRTYRQQETHRDSEETRTLHIKFETPESPVVLNPDNIVGVPRQLSKGVVDATVSEVCVSGAAPETLRDGRSGRDRHEGSEGQGPSHEGTRDSRTCGKDDPLAACLQGP